MSGVSHSQLAIPPLGHPGSFYTCLFVSVVGGAHESCIISRTSCNLMPSTPGPRLYNACRFGSWRLRQCNFVFCGKTENMYLSYAVLLSMVNSCDQVFELRRASETKSSMNSKPSSVAFWAAEIFLNERLPPWVFTIRLTVQMRTIELSLLFSFYFRQKKDCVEFSYSFEA